MRQAEVAEQVEDDQLAAEATLRRRHMTEIIETMRLLESAQFAAANKVKSVLKESIHR